MTNTWLCWAKISSPRDHLVLFWIQEIQLLCGMIFNWTVLHVGPYFLLDIMFDRKYFQKSHKKVLIMSHRNKASQYKWLFHLSDAKTFWKMYTLTQFSRKSYLCCGRYIVGACRHFEFYIYSKKMIWWTFTSITILPTPLPPTLMSKKTLGLAMAALRICVSFSFAVKYSNHAVYAPNCQLSKWTKEDARAFIPVKYYSA